MVENRSIKDSQNFIHSAGLVRELVKLSNLSNTDTVYEIGPGKGIITAELQKYAKKVIAVEADGVLYKKLKTKFCSSANVEIIHQDFLKMELPKSEYKVFSNIPFNLTSDILSKLLLSENRPKDLYLVMQYEAALKYAGKPYCSDCYKSLLLRPLYAVNFLYKFNATDFTPVPNVDIIFAHFHLKECCDIKNNPMIEYWDFLAFVFSAPGKTFKEKTKKIFSYEQQKRIRKQHQIDEESGISMWTYEQWLGMFDAYSKLVDAVKKKTVCGAYRKLCDEQSKLKKVHRSRGNGFSWQK